MTTHYKIKNQVQVYHIDSNLTVGAAFDHPLDAKVFLATIPPECDVPDIQNHDDLKKLLRNHRATYPKPKRIEWYTVLEAFYVGVLDEITPHYGLAKLQHRTSAVWEKESGYHNQTLVIHIPTGYTIGIGDNRQGKEQIKLWSKEGFAHKGNGLFVAGRFKTQSHGRVTLQ